MTGCKYEASNNRRRRHSRVLSPPRVDATTTDGIQGVNAPCHVETRPGEPTYATGKYVIPTDRMGYLPDVCDAPATDYV